MSRNRWNTWFPPPGEIKTLVDSLADERQLDVHTATIRLDNGRWTVLLEATDADMQDVVVRGELTNGGAVLSDAPEYAC